MINFSNRYLSKKGLLAFFVIASFLMNSCKKDPLNDIQDLEALPSTQNNEMYRGIAPPQHDSIVTIMHLTPSCITSMMQDPDFSEWDFDNMHHQHECDTIGFYTYIIPNLYFSNNTFLCVGVNNDTIVMRFALLLPPDFDYQTYYNQNITAYTYAYSYDFEEEFFDGILNVRNNTFTFYYVNEDMFTDDNTKVPPFWKWNDMNPCQRFFTCYQLSMGHPNVFYWSNGVRRPSNKWINNVID